ncbi:malto-oligosyltrehalose synthase [Beijerinckia sp. L45]|uniref:malto-oligosyltrehalose synthase n=1 Tax=Beijerinckia sp. L45 TaxID=1641855 RepID=UPI00131E1FDD|nr:malto-oligosyltrehalose synthase [Beijerinckia sp. L45]
MSVNDDIYRLAELAGVERRYRDAYGKEVESPAVGVRAVLASLGYDVGNDRDLADSVAWADGQRQKLVRSTVPIEAGRDTVVALSAGDGDPVAWHLTFEDGSTRDGSATARRDGAGASLALAAVPEGYHQLHVTAAGREAEATLIAAPSHCFLPDVFRDTGHGFGITAQIYGLRSEGNFGIGDFSDVGDLAEGAGRLGASFLGLSPVHALFPSDRTKVSPYSPSSRLFIDPLYIDPRQVPGFVSSPVAHDLNAPETAERLDTLRAAALVDHAAVWNLKRDILGKLWSVFVQAGDGAFNAFRVRGGEGLELHATFEALSEKFAAEGKHWIGEWPEAYRDVNGAAVSRFRQDHPQAVAFHVWLQWVADSQLGVAQARALKSGMPVGLYRDLAVGVDSGGAEMWARPDWFTPGVAIGAPPDLLGPDGQNWGLPPFNPKTLEEQGLQAFRALLTANMRHAGAIRIDHAFQLQRLFVIPDGMPASQGAYINYPFETMLAAVRLESQRARSIVIAEDLGTAPEGFSDAIMRSDLLSYRILTFEREHDGGFKPPSSYPRKALAAVATHDLPTFAGWWKGLDTDLRETFGVYTKEQANAERAGRAGEIEQFIEALALEKIASPDASPESPFEGASRYLAKSPAMLLALQLEDVLDDVHQANLPGPDRGHPNWKRKLTRSVEGILAPGGPLAQAADAMIEEGRHAGSSAPRRALPPPSSTYRLQFHKDFTFADATKILPFLKGLGVSHVYASPIQKARPGSTHGYDTVDPREINPELGGIEGFQNFAAAIKAEGLELLLDIVPNHMGVGGADNHWWLSVLEWGELSPYGDTFDIDWERLGAHGKLVAPFLGGQYGEILERGDLKLAFDKADGSFSVWHYEHRFPICPLTYPDILDRAVAVDAGEGGNGVDGLLRIAEEMRALAQEPAHRRHDVVETCEKLKRRIAALAQRANVAQVLDQAVAVFNGIPGLPESFGAMHRLLEQQAYRLSFWRVAASDVNYRRFFDIDGLAGVRIEKPAVFERVHELVFDLVERGLIQGLRIDHIDGLADPKAYAQDLQRAVGPNFYIVAEKILEPGEELRDWPLAGTTGYEMLNLIDGVFVDSSVEAAFDRIYKETTGFTQSYEQALDAAKTQVLLESFSSELESLVSDMKRIADANRLTRDYSVNAIRVALADLVSAFPVYRTYITPTSMAREDRTLVVDVVNDAKAATALPDRGVHDFIGSVLLGTLPTGRPGQASAALVNRFRRRFQQLTGPVMAKSLEDTLFYRYVRFLALNEVGGEPSRFGISLDAFHASNVERAATWPHALTASATHDTKRGEDARARLLSLSESPELWQEVLAIWKAEAGVLVEPDLNDQYMLLQSIIGAWPIELLETDDASVLDALRERLFAYIPKALREAKRHSKWIEPNEVYEGAAKDLVARLLSDGSRFIETMRPLLQDIAQRGMLISLARTVLKCTVPGVPDFYQGTGLWDFSLVDPDNRRPVDYAQRDSMLASSASATDLLAGWQDGAIKLQTIAKLLADRQAHRAFYANADYQPLLASGPGAEKILAFTRSESGQTLVVIVPRLSGKGRARAVMPVGSTCWQDTALVLPVGRWTNVVDDTQVDATGPIAVAKLLSTLPFAVLRMVR